MVVLTASDTLLRDYVGQLNLYPFFQRPRDETWSACLTLTYVAENYFDILADVSRGPGHAARPWWRSHGFAWPPLRSPWSRSGYWRKWIFSRGASGRSRGRTGEWFFNPFGWQLRLLHRLRADGGMVARARPVDPEVCDIRGERSRRRERPARARARHTARWALLSEVRGALVAADRQVGLGTPALRPLPRARLSRLGLRWGRAARGLPRRIVDGPGARAWRTGLAVILKVGQQSLAVFIASMYLARLMGVALDVTGRTPLNAVLINLAGMALLVAVAYGAGWFKSAPWRRPARSAAP